MQALGPYLISTLKLVGLACSVAGAATGVGLAAALPAAGLAAKGVQALSEQGPWFNAPGGSKQQGVEAIEALYRGLQGGSAEQLRAWAAEEVAPVPMSEAQQRGVQQFLGAADKAHQWGGLTRVQTQGGGFFWMCPDCAAQHSTMR